MQSIKECHFRMPPMSPDGLPPWDECHDRLRDLLQDQGLPRAPAADRRADRARPWPACANGCEVDEMRAVSSTETGATKQSARSVQGTHHRSSGDVSDRNKSLSVLACHFGLTINTICTFLGISACTYSVYKRMSRAIIHNSDYPSLDDAKAAIDRHFEERNDHFQKHPQRAGKKIWGKEREPATFSDSSNCKDPRYR